MAEGPLVEVPLIPKVEFEFEETPIGRGGFGTVYRAKHKDFGIVAVKTLIDNGMLPQKHIRTLKKEARKLLEVCDHTSVLSLLGIIMEKDNYSLILEYMALGSLADFRKEFKVQWPLIARIMTDVVRGMEFLHTHDPQILHLDLKSDNILLNGRVRAKIADFGLSEWRTITMTVTRSTDESKGRRCTVSHVPPEVWSNVNLPSNTQFDIYSFGIVLWEMLSGGVPYRGTPDDLVRSAVLSGQRPDFSQIPKDCSPKFTQLMTRCWHQKPAQRPPFKDIKKEVDKFYREEFERDIVKSLKNVRAEIVADYPHDDPVYTQTADIDNMQIPTFVVPIAPAPEHRPGSASASGGTQASVTAGTPGPSSVRDDSVPTAAMETIEQGDDNTPLDVKFYKLEDDLDSTEKLMRKVIHNPVIMRMIHSSYAKEIFQIDEKTQEALKNPKKVQRMIESDLALQWEMKFFNYDVERELSGLNAEALRKKNELYNEVYKENLKKNYYRNSSSREHSKRERRQRRVDETMRKNPNVSGGSSSDHYFRLKKALENPGLLRQAMIDHETGNSESSLTTIDTEVFELMKDPYLLIGVLYQETDLLYMLSDNYPDMFLKMLQGLHTYSTYTSCYNQNHRNRAAMMYEMMHFREFMHGPDDPMMAEMGPRMRRMRRHPMHDFDDMDEDMMMHRMHRMMMMRGDARSAKKMMEKMERNRRGRDPDYYFKSDNTKSTKSQENSSASTKTSTTTPATATAKATATTTAAASVTTTAKATATTTAPASVTASAVTTASTKTSATGSSNIPASPAAVSTGASASTSGMSSSVSSESKETTKPKTPEVQKDSTAKRLMKGVMGLFKSSDKMPSELSSSESSDVETDAGFKSLDSTGGGFRSSSLETDAAPPKNRVNTDIVPGSLVTSNTPLRPSSEHSTLPVHARPINGALSKQGITESSTGSTEKIGPISENNDITQKAAVLRNEVAMETQTSAPVSRSASIQQPMVSPSFPPLDSIATTASSVSVQPSVGDPDETKPIKLRSSDSGHSSLISGRGSTGQTNWMEGLNPGHRVSEQDVTSQVSGQAGAAGTNTQTQVRHHPRPPASNTTPPPSGAKKQKINEDTSLASDVSMDANIDSSMVSRDTKSKARPKTVIDQVRTGDGKMANVIRHERGDTKTEIVWADGKAKNMPNIQLGDKNVMYVDNRKDYSSKSKRANPPPNLTKSGRLATTDDFDLVAEKIGADALTLSEKLKIGRPAFDQIKIDFEKEGNFEVCFQMLKKWKMMGKQSATVANLALALSKAERNDIANMLK